MEEKGADSNKLESLLAQQIKDIYRQSLGQSLNNIHFQQFNLGLLIVLEGVTTTIEKLLDRNSYSSLSSQIRAEIDKLILPQIRDAIEQGVNKKIVDFLSDTTIDSDVTGIIIIFGEKHQVASQEIQTRK